MMREILFRGKTWDGEWEYGSLHIEMGETDADGNRQIDHRILGLRGECRYVIPGTIGQFTGMTDKNGKKILEGDICQVCLDPEICVGVVEYDERTASFIAKVGETEMLTFLDYMTAHKKVGDAVWIEVIGNIHDNPELMEG